MGSRPVGEWSNRSSMHGVAPDRMGLRSMRLVARGRMKPTSFWRAMAGAGGQLHDQGPCRNSIRTDRAAQQIFSDARASRGTSQKLQRPPLLPSFPCDAFVTTHGCPGLPLLGCLSVKGSLLIGQVI